MATPLDASFLQNFQVVFTFLLVFAVTMAVLNLAKVFGEGQQSLNALIALCLAIISLFFPVATRIIANMAPWIVVLFFFIAFLLVGYQMFGISGSEIAETVKAQPGIKWALFITFFLILIIAFSSAYGQGLVPGGQTAQPDTSTAAGGGASSTGSTATNDFGTNVKATFFHPKVIGLMFILLVAVAAVGMLGGRAKA